ncbi:hypothetical protein QU487_04720 [Crenobacter sp. SG2305]|uniref:hypothetical protein n=1 Tax=Crenobacter oryzisoli TaxID=3056844 RepID=UPI0025AAD928|nr:hypothetical protein [Crenobacter sp. SG2305]MDN0082058.1 hypothetical protein [Crenobacter sp. SG2305]
MIKNSVKKFCRSSFDRISLISSIIIFLFTYSVIIWETYGNEAARINDVSMEKFGVSISGELGFFQVLDSANFSLLRSFILSVLVVFLPSIVLMVLVRFCIREESHVGWKRLSLVSLAIAIFYSFIKMGLTSITDLTVWSIWLSDVALLGIFAVRWVIRGFGRTV